MKRLWISVKRGLVRGPEHRKNIGEAVWLFLYMLDIANWETGRIEEWTDQSAADDLESPVRTIRDWRQRLERGNYVTSEQGRHKLALTIHNWTNPREYTGELYNRREGDAAMSPEDDTNGDTNGLRKDVTPTSSSKDKDQSPVSPENAKNPMGVSNKIYAGLPVTEADLASERNVSQATAEFERALMVRIPWGKESKFMAWVSEQYAKDATCFARYAKWQKDDPFKSMSAKQIRHTPQEFMDTWPAFEAMFKPKSADGPDPELERLRREAEMPWSKPPERKP